MKKSIILILVLTMILMATCVGCNESDSDTETTESTETTETTTEETTEDTTEATEDATETELSDEYVEWSVLTVEFVNAPTTDDQAAWQYILEKFNVQLTFEVVNSTDFDTRVNLALASDDTPNIICNTISKMTSYYNTGKIVDLTSYVDEYAPDMLEEINKDEAVLKNTLDDEGRYFFFPRIQWDYTTTYMAMNTALLDELEIDVPTTTDEFLSALIAMQEATDEDMYWTTGAVLTTDRYLYWPIFYAYGTHFDWVHFETGTYVYGPYERSEEMRAALAYLNEAYEAGVINPEYETMDQDTYLSMVSEGSISAVYGWVGTLFPTDEDGNAYSDEMYLSGEVESDYTIIGALEGPEGYQYSRVAGLINYGLFITDTMPEEDLARAVSLFNWFYTDEGETFSCFGIEGETYTVEEDGSYVYTDEVLTLGINAGLRVDGFFPANFLYVNVPEAYEQLTSILWTNGVAANADYTEAVSPILTGTDEEVEIVNQLGTDISNYVYEMLPKFVNGTFNTEEDFDDFIAQLESMGVEEYIAAVKSEYDRWLER